MKRPRGKCLSAYVLLAFIAATTIGLQHLQAQDPAQAQAQDQDETTASPQLKGYFLTIPWTEGAPEDAVSQALAGTTIPLSSYTIAATKDGKTFTGTIVGSSPFATTKAGTKVPVVVVPLKVTVKGVTFDPDAPNSCDGDFSAMTRFNLSPLVQDTALTFNGVHVGTTQYENGFLRAEFWSEVGGSPAYGTTLSPVTYASEISVTAPAGSIFSSGCTQLGIVGYSWLGNYMSSEITKLQKSGVVRPTDFVIFLVKDVVQSPANPPNASDCCILGFHTAQGSPVQTWGVMEWDTSGQFGPETDAAISSHEIDEWMNDPLGSNPTPAWGHVGQVGGCQDNFEVGDPLTGHVMPLITLNGKKYHMQELAFFSWFFNKDGVASLGAGGKFSGNGTFKGPSKACPPGGTN
jgi:hypothetical protein